MGPGRAVASARQPLARRRGGGADQRCRPDGRLLRLSARDHALACLVIDSLDEDGYCRVDLDEVTAAVEVDPPVDASELGMALRLVQSFEPAGVGARSVGECLSLQLEKVDAAHRDTARRIVAAHLDRLAQRDVPGIARLLELPVADVEAACVALRRLDPRPGWRFSRPDTRYVSPDVVVRKRRGEWVAQLNADVVPRVRLNRMYAELFQRHREAGHRELGAHLQEARWTIRNAEQRFATILSVGQAILRRQRLFFDHGPLAMKPLALRDIADELGIHESTVCRVTNNKYIATPHGLFELKHFFSRAMPMASGGACSAVAIRSVVKELIEAEDPEQPLSDVDITQRLARQGLTVARRTVTKYRQGLKIAPAERRRSHGAAGHDAASADGDRLAA
jgi:RNA polymerase sigma-54 factor